MAEVQHCIDPARRAVPTPRSMVDENGRCVFGTFDREFEEMDLVKLKKPTRAPQVMNRLKLTLWEAAEVHLREGVLLAVACDMGVFGKTLNIFYDKRTKKVYTWDTNTASGRANIAPNLLRGSVTEAVSKVSRVKYVNRFEDGACTLEGSHEGQAGSISYHFELKRLSLPSVVSIPFGENRPLYSQKDFFRAEGVLTVNGEILHTDGDSTAIVDDHKGYYPRRAHYDWVTTLGRAELDGERKFFAFNLTRNQSTDQDRYNENLIWTEGRTSLLPPVRFLRTPESKDFKDYAEWLVQDEYDMVNLKFKVYGISPMILHVKVVMIDYYVAFGELEGYIRDEDGHKYILDGLMGMGEDKSLLF